MRMLQVSTFAVFALTVGFVWQTSSSEPVTSSVPVQEAVLEQAQPTRCGAKAQSQGFSEMSAPGAEYSSQGPRTLEQSGALPGTWGKCIDCTDCLSGMDCVHTSHHICYDYCP